jgi:hypothetical protein
VVRPDWDGLRINTAGNEKLSGTVPCRISALCEPIYRTGFIERLFVLLLETEMVMDWRRRERCCPTGSDAGL